MASKIVDPYERVATKHSVPRWSVEAVYLHTLRDAGRPMPFSNSQVEDNVKRLAPLCAELATDDPDVLAAYRVLFVEQHGRSPGLISPCVARKRESLFTRQLAHADRLRRLDIALAMKIVADYRLH